MMVNIDKVARDLMGDFFIEVDYSVHMRVSLSSHLISFFAAIKGFVSLEAIKENEVEFSDFEENLSRATDLYEHMRKLPELDLMRYYHFKPDIGAINLVVEGYIRFLSIEERIYPFLDKLTRSQFIRDFAKNHDRIFKDSLDAFGDITQLISMTSGILKGDQERVEQASKNIPISEQFCDRLHSATIRVIQANDNASKYSLANIVDKIQEYLPSDQDEDDDDLDDSSEDLGSSETARSGYSACASDDSSKEVEV